MPGVRPVRSVSGLFPAVPSLLLLPPLLLVGCGGDSTDPGELPVLSVSPATAPPGAPIRITASDVGPIPSGATISIGGFPGPLKAVSAGEWLSAVPLFLTESDRALPEAPVDVVMLNGETPVAEGSRALTVTAAPEAAGASLRALERLSALSAALESVADDMPGDPGPDAQYLYAVTRTLTELIDGTGPHSLRTAITSLDGDPTALALLDSWFEASGVLDVIDAQARLLEAIAAGAPPSTVIALQTFRAGVPTVLSDVELARRMQLYEVAKLFGETVISPTAATYGNIIGIGTGALGLAGVVAAPVSTTANVISAVLAVTDFMINKVAVGVLPARIDSFGMDVTKALLEPGEVTDARLKIIASNAPPPIGVQDMVGLILAGLGALPAREAASLREKLLEVASFALNTMQSFISQYASANPGANLDTELISVPDMEWEAVVTDPRLVARLSHTPQTITGLADAVNWQASSEGFGEGRIYARTMVGPSLLSLPPGFEYNGGAFGDNIVATEPVVVMVQRGGLVLEAEFPATIAAGASAELRIRAGHDGTGGTSWDPGIQLTLTPEGGSVAATMGITDAEGYFTTTAQLGDGSTEIRITIEASDGNLSVSRTMSATAIPATGVVPLWNGSFSLANTWQSVDLDANVPQDRADADPANLTGFAFDVGATTSASAEISDRGIVSAGATAAASQIAVIRRDPETGHMVALEASGSTQLSGDVMNSTGEFSRAQGQSTIWLEFRVTEGPVEFSLTGTCTGTPESAGLNLIPLSILLQETENADFERVTLDSCSPNISGVMPPGLYELNVTHNQIVVVCFPNSGGLDCADSKDYSGSYEFRMDLRPAAASAASAAKH